MPNKTRYIYARERKALDVIFREWGAIARLAEELGLSTSAVHEWKARGIPPQHVLDVERITGMPRHRIRPDIFPREKPAATKREKA